VFTFSNFFILPYYQIQALFSSIRTYSLYYLFAKRNGGVYNIRAEVSMQKAISEILKNEEKIIKISASSPAEKTAEYSKIIVRPILSKNGIIYQAERFKNTQVFHLNMEKTALENYLDMLFTEYSQICVFYEGITATFYVNKFKRAKKTEAPNTLKKTVAGNDRKKEYILNEGDVIPALVDLGIFTKDYGIIKSKYDKFKQINKFIEIIDDELKNFDGDKITVLDFGCGKSYLTFILRHYLVTVRKLKAEIIGYDLKKDVVENCNALAEKYGYDDLTFVVADVKKDPLYDKKIDMIISLHACDTATDYALNYAVKKNVKYIFSVPCCQHEINLSIKKGGEMDILLKYGIIKERVSALLTDAIRASILEDMGYDVDVMEFVDLAHSPKNLMIRAVKTREKTSVNREKIAALSEKYGFTQTLFKLMETKTL